MRAPMLSPLHSVPSATGAIARLVCGRLRQAGLPLVPLLSSAGLSIEQIDDLNARLEVRAQVKFLELAAEQLQDALLGFHLAREFELREVGLLYYVLSSSKDFTDAMNNARRYCRIVNEGIEIEFHADRATVITLNYVRVDRQTDRHQIEFWLFSLVRMCRELTRTRLAPHEVNVRHFREAMPPEFRTLLGCDVRFGTAADEIIFPKFVGTLPIVGADSHLNGLLVRYAEDALADRMAGEGIRTRVEKAIAPLLPHGTAKACRIARELGMSRRTLARLLAAEGLTFSAILDQYRADLAKAYLAHRDLRISQVAWLLGYHEVSAFTHAFKRWTGVTPRQLRASSGATDRPGGTY
jgi:AraC-like DNA-binding protein